MCYTSIKTTKDLFCAVLAVTNLIQGAQFVFWEEGRGAYSKIVALEWGLIERGA